MNESQLATREPPSPEATESYAGGAFGRRSRRYYCFLEVLLDGLLEYEARKGGGDHASTPLPAA